MSGVSPFLLEQAHSLGGAEFKFAGDTFSVRNKPAIDLGELSIAPFMDAFESVYPDGFGSEYALYRLDYLNVDDAEREQEKPVFEALAELVSATDVLLAPLKDEFDTYSVHMSVFDEIVNPEYLSQNDRAHVDVEEYPTALDLALVASDPRNTQYAKDPVEFSGTIDTKEGKFLYATTAADLPPEAWTTAEEHAFLFGSSSTYHRRQPRPADATYRYRGLWRVNLRPKQLVAA